METRTEQNILPFISEIEEKPFRLLVVYDSEDSKIEAAGAAEFILRELGDGIPAEKTFWNVRSLAILDVQDRAITQAANADVILLALSASQPP